MSLQGLYEYYASHPESGWIMKPEKVPHLFSLVKKNPIKKVLDLGTGIGCTAAIIALALEEKGVEDYEIHTVEQYPKCVDIAKDIMPKVLRNNITFHLAEPTTWSTELLPYRHFSTFKELPEGDWDLILVDGPGGFMEGENYIDLPNGDVMKLLLENKIKAESLVVFDGRVAAFQLLEKYFGDNFYFRPTATNIPLYVLERIAGDAIFKDDMLNSMRLAGYFANKGIDKIVEQ